MVLVTKTNLPPLKNGDRLTRIEFERRYRTMPEVKKAELVEGVVHLVVKFFLVCGYR